MALCFLPACTSFSLSRPRPPSLFPCLVNKPHASSRHVSSCARVVSIDRKSTDENDSRRSHPNLVLKMPPLAQSTRTLEVSPGARVALLRGMRILSQQQTIVVAKKCVAVGLLALRRWIRCRCEDRELTGGA